MSLKGVNQIATGRVPQLTGSIVAPSDKFISVFIKAAVRQREDMAFQLLNQLKLLLSFFFDFLYQFLVSQKVLLMMVLICGRLDYVMRGYSTMISLINSSMSVSLDRFSKSMHLDSTSPLLRVY